MTGNCDRLVVRTETELRVSYPLRPGQLTDVLCTLRQAECSPKAHLIYRHEKSGVGHFVCDQPSAAATVLRRDGRNGVDSRTVVTVLTRNSPETFSKLLRILEDGEVAIRYGYATPADGELYAVFRTGDDAKARELLRDYLQLSEVVSDGSGESELSREKGDNRAPLLQDFYLAKGKAERMYRLLQTVHTLLSRDGVPYWVCEGTLLGAVRHGGLIPWDSDMDISVPRSHRQDVLRLKNELRFLGYHLLPYFPAIKVFPIDGDRIAGHSHRWPFLDIFLVRFEGGRTYFSDVAEGRWPSSYFTLHDLFPLKSYRFGDAVVQGPNEPVPYLNRVFGEDWPDYAITPFWDHTREEATSAPRKVRLTERDRAPA